MHIRQKKINLKKTISLVIIFVIILTAFVSLKSIKKTDRAVYISQPTPVNPVSLITPPKLFPLKSLNVQTVKNVPILVYHRFGIPPLSASVLQIHYFVSPENFTLQMQYLKDHDYNPITLDALVESILNATPLPKNPVVLTFDDGWKSQYKDAFPVLKQFGYTGSFFIVTGYVNYPSYMTWDMIKELDKSKMEIGSHTVHHLDLEKLSLQEAQEEIVDSKNTLEKELGHSITTFAYPDYGKSIVIQDLLKFAGYLGARAGWTSTTNTNLTIYNLKSQEVINNPNPFVIK